MNKTPKTALQSALYFYNGNYILILKALNTENLYESKLS